MYNNGFLGSLLDAWAAVLRTLRVFSEALGHQFMYFWRPDKVCFAKSMLMSMSPCSDS